MGILVLRPVVLVAVAVELHLPGPISGKGNVQGIIATFRPPVVTDKEDDLLSLGVGFSVGAHAMPQHLPLPDKLLVGLWQQDLQLTVRPLELPVFFQHGIKTGLNPLGFAFIQLQHTGCTEPVMCLPQLPGPQLLLGELLAGVELLGKAPGVRKELELPDGDFLLLKVPFVFCKAPAVLLYLPEQHIPASVPAHIQ